MKMLLRYGPGFMIWIAINHFSVVVMVLKETQWLK